MDSNLMWELIGYLGSALVLVSLLMSSIVKLRIVNALGSLIFCIYAFKIHSIPTAVMNVCLVGIDLYFLRKLVSDKHTFSCTEVVPNDSTVQYILKLLGEDVKKFFGTNDVSGADHVLIAFDRETVAGILAGVKEGDDLRVIIDYTTPQYRDCKVEKYLYSVLEAKYAHLVYTGDNEEHIRFVKKMGYEEVGGRYVKTL